MGAMLVKVGNPDYVAGIDMEKEIAACIALCSGRKTLKKVFIEQHAGRLVDLFQEIECTQCESTLLPTCLPESVYLYFFC